MLAAAAELDRSVEKLRLALQAQDIGDIRTMHADVRRQFTALRENPEWIASTGYGTQLRSLVKSLSEADRILVHANDDVGSSKGSERRQAPQENAHDSSVRELATRRTDSEGLTSMLANRTRALQDIRLQMEAFRAAHLDNELAAETE
ncbi:MAG: hypothetical protein AAGH53_10080 [Pseudomonadota bacterium]